MKRQKILLVESSEVIVAGLERLLENSDFEITRAFRFRPFHILSEIVYEESLEFVILCICHVVYDKQHPNNE